MYGCSIMVRSLEETSIFATPKAQGQQLGTHFHYTHFL